MNCLILARGGSKGVPRKNIKLLGGLPLIAYPIIAAKNSKKIEDIYVSTDDNEISEIAKNYGAKIIKRPKSISGDRSTDIEAFRHACDYLNDYNDIVHLRATTPLVKSDVIDKAIDVFRKSECTSLRSGHETSESAFKYVLKKGDYWSPIIKDMNISDINLPRQTFQKTFIPNGYVDIVKPNFFMNLNNDFHGDKIHAFVTGFSPEIDTLDDFYYIEYMIQKNDYAPI